MIIPSKFHLFWVGNKQVPVDDLQNLCKLARLTQNTPFKVYFWTNKPNAIQAQLVKNNLEIKNIEIHTIDELYEEAKQSGFYQDKDKLKRFFISVERELVGSANEAGAVDLLRLECLRQKGGYYMDTDDFIILLDPSQKLIANDTPHGVLLAADAESWFDPKPIAKDPIRSMFSLGGGGMNFGFQKINNNLLAAIPNHPIIEMAINDALNQYQLMDDLIVKEISVPEIDAKNQKTGIMKTVKISQMDVKRLLQTPERYQLTIKSAGPLLLQRASYRFVQEEKVNPDELVFTPYFDTVHRESTAAYKLCNNLSSREHCVNSWIGNKMQVSLCADPSKQDYKANQWLIVKKDHYFQLFYPDKATQSYVQIPDNFKPKIRAINIFHMFTPSTFLDSIYELTKEGLTNNNHGLNDTYFAAFKQSVLNLAISITTYPGNELMAFNKEQFTLPEYESGKWLLVYDYSNKTLELYYPDEKTQQYLLLSGEIMAKLSHSIKNYYLFYLEQFKAYVNQRFELFCRTEIHNKVVPCLSGIDMHSVSPSSYDLDFSFFGPKAKTRYNSPNLDQIQKNIEDAFNRLP